MQASWRTPCSSGSLRKNKRRCSPQGTCCKASQASEPILLYTCASAGAHFKEGHPESPARIKAIQQALTQQPPEFHECLKQVKSRRIPSFEELRACHGLAYLEKVQEVSSRLQVPTMVDDSTYISPGSYDAVAQGVGAVLDLVDALVNLNGAGSPHQLPFPGGPQGGDWARGAQQLARPSCCSGGAVAGFALVRPPGHHVLPGRPMGFGLLNTISVATRYLQATHGVRRALIFDFDVHHGNGTMEIFYNDPDILYVSTHQDGLWPRTGRMSNVGEGDGKGSTINVPLPSGSGDGAMHRIFSQILWPAATKFQPEFILVSAGYDAHMADPLGQLQFQTGTYEWMSAELARMASVLCEGRLLFVLEGGYHLSSLGASVVASMHGLMHSGSVTGATAGHALGGASTVVQPEPMHKVEDLLLHVQSLHEL